MKVITIGTLSDRAVFNISAAFWDGTVVVAIIELVVEEYESSQIELEQPWQPLGQSWSHGHAKVKKSQSISSFQSFES